MTMTHSRAVALMILVTFLWSLAGVVTRHLDAARSFEVTFWRSAFNAIGLTLALSVIRGFALWRDLAGASRLLWLSGLCWAVMFTAFMLAMTLTTVANVLVTMASGPLITALFARIFLKHRLPWRTWGAILVSGAGIVWMFGAEIGLASFVGMLVALLVPLAASINWTMLQHVGHISCQPSERPGQDMLPAVLIGALLSAVVTLPLALPLQASGHDLGLLALLGIVQLSMPCLLVVRLSRELPAPEIALLGLLEVVFGVTWVWLGANEIPVTSTLIGGVLVIGALFCNEAVAILDARKPTQ